jgi:hypothetical protein
MKTMCIYTSRIRILYFACRWCGQWPRETTHTMATKMAGHLTVQERAQTAARYEVWNLAVAVQRRHTVKGRNATIHQETIKNCHSKLLTTVSVTDAWKSGRPSTFRSEENVVLVQCLLTSYPPCRLLTVSLSN